MTANGTDLIIDMNSIYARAWYATQGQCQSTLISTLQLAIMCFDKNRVGDQIDRALFCWDAGQKKHKNRDERPQAYEDTKARVKECLEALWGIQSVRIEPLEADDVMATAATHSDAEHVIIATGDKDLLQLNSEKISIFDIATKGMIGRREILQRWKIKRPIQLAIALAIQGDSSDNISGIKGWGPKKVEKLFESVTPDMEFEAALSTIVSQIPENKQEEFFEALDLTLLDCDIPGVPSPVEPKWCKVDSLADYGLNELRNHYSMVYSTYPGGRVSRFVDVSPDE